jgi:hypothetical protein
MNKRPKCALKGCSNEGFVLFNGKWLCGDCLIKLGKQREENFWREVECQQE